MDYLKKINQNIEAQKDKMITTLSELIQIKSVNEDAITTTDGKVLPFGQGVQDAFVYTLAKGLEFGFETENIDNYGGHLEIGGLVYGKTDDVVGTCDEIVGILGHLDVVPEGDDWTVPPFGGEVRDGKIFGRGTTDDKGPVVACLYAMKAISDSGYRPEKKIRLILGLDEETSWSGMYYYLDRVKAPDYGFTPDADFPVINGEMGFLVFDLAKKFTKSAARGLELRSLKGGTAANMVADNARAVVRSEDTQIYEKIKAIGAEYRLSSGNKIKFKGIGKSLEITADGIAAHGAHPEEGLNAISIIFELLGKLNFANESTNEFVEFYNKYIGFDIRGSKIGCACKDDISGELIFNVGFVSLTPEAGSFTINIRYPVTVKDETVYNSIKPVLDEYDFGIIKIKHQVPIFVKPEGPMISTLMEIYQKYTGDLNSKPLVIGEGTYARATKNIVAFGAVFPGDLDRMHEKDECLEIDKFMLMTQIYAEALYKLSLPDFIYTAD